MPTSDRSRSPSDAEPAGTPVREQAAADRVERIVQQWRRERPDLDVSPQEVVGRMSRLTRHLEVHIEPELRARGLREGEFDVLAALRREGSPFALESGEIAAHTMVTSSAITKRVDRLLAAGLVERVRARDARIRIVRLTEEGVRVVDETLTAHMANERRLLADLTPQDRSALAAILGRWARAVEGRGSD